MGDVVLRPAVSCRPGPAVSIRGVAIATVPALLSRMAGAAAAGASLVGIRAVSDGSRASFVRHAAVMLSNPATPMRAHCVTAGRLTGTRRGASTLTLQCAIELHPLPVVGIDRDAAACPATYGLPSAFAAAGGQLTVGTL